jgi:hypothetical protein
MRILLLTGWLLLPVIAVAWHLGPGQDFVHLDRVSSVLARADLAAADGNWTEADELYEEALRLLPPERSAESRRVRLERAKAQMHCKKLPVAHQGLTELVQELSADASADPKLLAESRSALASAQYYLTWLLRLEGFPREDWESEIEAARQNYTLLAEQAEAGGDTAAAQRHEKDLESAIRLARMDLAELQGLPLPSQ